MRCVSFCTARNYNLTAIASYYRNKQYQIKLSRNVLHVSLPKKKRDIFFFNQGCFVSWGLFRRDEIQILRDIKEFSTMPLDKIEKDFFIFRVGSTTKIRPHERFNMDVITLENNTTPIKLAISYGLAQSVKLESFEEAIQKTTKKNETLPEELALKGKISLSGKAISQRMGEILLERSSVNLSGEFLDMPEYFWQYPNLEAYYLMTEKYLDLATRVAALNHRLDVLHEVFDMLTSQLQHRHSSLLETIIIILIALEIVISIFHAPIF